MSSVEQMARNRLADAYDLRGWKDEANALRSGMPMDSPTVAALDTIAAALREQPEARGVVDGELRKLRDIAALLTSAYVGMDPAASAINEAADNIAALAAAQQPEDLKAWSLRMAEKEQDQHVSAGSHGIEDVPVQEGDGELPGMWSASDFTGSDPEERAQHRAMRTAPPSAPVGVDAAVEHLKDRAFPNHQCPAESSAVWNVALYEMANFLTQQPAQAAPGDGVSLIAAERRRQVQVEGWAPEHDDEHTDGAMAAAAACYASFAALSDVRRSSQGTIERMLEDWPWDAEWWKPSDRIRDLTKAGALIAAEIDRLQRATPPGDDAAGGGHG